MTGTWAGAGGVGIGAVALRSGLAVFVADMVLVGRIYHALVRY
jgi:hypothetical protein